MVLAELERLKGITFQALLACPMTNNAKPYSEEPLLDLGQVSTLLNLPLSRTRELSRRQDGFPITRIGKHIRVKPRDLWNWIDQIQQEGLAKELDHRYSSKCHVRRRTQEDTKTLKVDST